MGKDLKKQRKQVLWPLREEQSSWRSKSRGPEVGVCLVTTVEGTEWKERGVGDKLREAAGAASAE